MWQPIETVLRLLLKGIIRAYQLLLSPVLGGNCRFHPNCSAFALEAIETHGAGRGSWLAVKRILRCNPWYAGGVDPVPPAQRDHQSTSGAMPKTVPGGSAGL